MSTVVLVLSGFALLAVGSLMEARNAARRIAVERDAFSRTNEHGVIVVDSYEHGKRIERERATAISHQRFGRGLAVAGGAMLLLAYVKVA